MVIRYILIISCCIRAFNALMMDFSLRLKIQNFILGLPTTNLGLVNASGDVLKEFATLFFMPVEMPMPNQVMLNYRLQYPLIRDDFHHRVEGGVQTLDILGKLKNSKETSFLMEEDEIVSKHTLGETNVL